MTNRNIHRLEKDSKKSKEAISHWFKDVDKGSSMPSWYYKQQVAEEREWIQVAERQLKDDLVPTERIREIKAELRKRKSRYDQITAAERDVAKEIAGNGALKDKAAKRFEELGGIIENSLYSRDEMFNKPTRLASPREEAERIRFRNSIIKEYKILGAVLGEDSNPERLRKGH